MNCFKTILLLSIFCSACFLCVAVADDKGQPEMISDQFSALLSGKAKLPQSIDQIRALGSNVRAIPDRVEGENWNSEKSLKLNLMIKYFLILEKIRDPDFDFSRQPLLSVVPPKKTGLPTGSSPAAIKDRAMREEYERAIRDSHEYAATYRLQWRINDVEKFWNDYVMFYCSQYYSSKETQELRKIFEQYIPGDRTDLLMKGIEKEWQKLQR